MNVFLVYLIVVAGDVTGDLAWYGAGRWSRSGSDRRWGRYLGLNSERLQRIEQHFERHSGKTLVVGKFTQGVGALILFGAGAARMRPRRFLAFNLLATLPKSLGLLLFGYYFGKASGHASTILDYSTLATVMVAVLAVMIFVIPRHFTRQFR